LAKIYDRVNKDGNVEIEKYVEEYNNLVNRAEAKVHHLTHRLENIIYDTDSISKEQKIENRKERFDYALENVGGRVYSIHKGTKLRDDCYFLTKLLVNCNTPTPAENVIKNSLDAGNAFCFVGQSGAFTIRLACRIQIDGITIEHPKRDMTFDQNISNAPKEIQITASQNASDSFVDLGTYHFNPHIANSEYYSIKNPVKDQKYLFVTVNITDNHGNPDQTCIYRVKVHGFTDIC
jgi:SUN domain-containing protein 1/2